MAVAPYDGKSSGSVGGLSSLVIVGQEGGSIVRASTSRLFDGKMLNKVNIVFVSRK